MSEVSIDKQFIELYVKNDVITVNIINTVDTGNGGGGSGTVQDVSVVSANGFAGTVASPTISPDITISTTVTGLLKGNGTAVSAAVAGTDYAAASHTHSISDVTSLQTTLDGKAASSHTHAISDVTNLQTTLDGKAASSHSHVISDVTGLQTALDGKAASSHTHSISDVTNLQTTLDGKASSSHTHSISDVTNLQTSLDGKVDENAAITGATKTKITYDAKGLVTAGADLTASDLPTGIDAAKIADGSISNTEFQYLNNVSSNIQTQLNAKASSSHTHALDDLTDVTITSPSNNQVLKYNGTAWVNDTSPAGATNLDGLTDVTITSPSNNQVLKYNGTTWVNDTAPSGATDLDGLTDVTITGAASGEYLRYNGTAWVDASIQAGDLPTGIDAAKLADGTISNTEFQYLNGVTSAIQTQIDGKAATSHSHAISDVTGLQTALDGKVDENTAITGATKTKITYDAKGLVTAGADLAASDLPTGIDAAKIADGTISNTEFQYLNNVSSNIQTQLDGKAATSHTHAISDVTGLQTALDGKVDENAAITGATKTKITYDAKGLVTAGADANLDDLGNVVITTPSNNQVLTYNGTNWVNAAASGGGSGTVTSVALASGTTGTDVNISGSPITTSGTITLNIPDASGTARGLVTTGTQTIAGAKTFSSAPTFSTMTAKSVLFAGTNGVVSQNNSLLTWDDTNNSFTVSTESSTSTTRGINVRQANTGVQAAPMNFMKSRGTIAFPVNVSTNDLIGVFQFSSRLSGAFTSDRCIFGANQNTSTGIGLFFVAGSTDGNYTPSLYIHPSSNVIIGSTQTFLSASITDSGYKLDVNGTTRVQGQLTVSTGGAAITGNTTISTGNLTVSSLTSGSVLFAGTSGVLTQDNANFFWDDTNNRLGVGTNAPANPFDMVRGTLGAMGRGTYETASFSNNSDNKVGIYYAGAVGGGGASIVLGATNITANSNYPGFEIQLSPSATLASNALTFNYLSRNSSGTYVTGTTNIMCLYQAGNIIVGGSTNAGFKLDVVGTTRVQGQLTVSTGGAAITGNSTITGTLNVTSTFTLSDAQNIVVGSTTGTKIGTATSQKIGFWNVTPIVQPTTATAASTFVANTGTAVNDASTFDGYTIAQIVKALRSTGLLA